ncbi:hypothetical protein BJ878DRAFT_498660 [Calycina marina]|uniref:Uncharacterized protein n=1 Tax=Calycina marina TaxID=1763456 RepID=A0A9P8CGB0_9HELO|nr:hypothetical protein BJ878DRAFT_498660 [Calycina marina]
MANYGYGGGYTNTSHAGAEGGGFMGGSQTGSQDTPNGQRTYGKDTVRPVTIKQALAATFAHPTAEAKIDGADVTSLSLVGLITKVSAQATNTTFSLDDGTGTIDAKQWVDSDAGQENAKSMPTDGDYVHVWGTLKDFNGKRHIGVRTIRLIGKDFNEITHHMLEATAIHLQFTRGAPPTSGGAVEGGLFVGQTNGDAVTNGGPKPLPAHLSKEQRAIYKVLQEAPQGNEGLHVNRIAQTLGIPSNAVFGAGDLLLQEGMIYTTIDDETWAVLEY